MTKVIRYIHRPNLTELGMGNTHDKYMVGQDQELSTIFPEGVSVDLKDIYTGKTYSLYSKRENNEYRVKRMGDIYDDYHMDPGDEIEITVIDNNTEKEYFLKVNECCRVFLNPVKSSNNKIIKFEIINEDRLPGFTKEETFESSYSLMGKDHKVEIKYIGKEQKRKDSPIQTDVYEVKYDNEFLQSLKNGYYYLTIKGKDSILKSLPKSEFNIFMDNNSVNTSFANTNTLQQIFYGAPGTGKSHTIDDVLKAGNYDNIRTTFHPDSDYASFVGAYKPTMKTSTITKDGVKTIEEQIVYRFVPQAFLKAYAKAWLNFTEPFFLIIEEINRGNCAQIFGDLFQLLDRDEKGYSSYPIEADEDIRKFLSTDSEIGFADVDYDIKCLFPDDDIWEGKKLMLPPNLHIWATMNTSDQSLFPIDSAFKRRWDWKYIPIANGNKNWKINALGRKYDWWGFLNNINDIVEEATSSEDKKLGYYFVKADKEGNISAETFVSKVVFYLWNDVFKDYGFDWKNKEGQPVFKNEEGKDMTFKSFFYPDGSIKESVVSLILDNLQVSSDDDEDEVTDPEAPETNSGKHKHLNSISFSDGTVFNKVNSKTNYGIYLNALRKIGIEQAASYIEGMNYNRRGRPLISREKYPEIENDKDYSYIQEGDFYIIDKIVADTWIPVFTELGNHLPLLGIKVDFY